MSAAGLFDRNDFLLPADKVHLSVGGEAPYLKRHAAAHERYINDKSDGHPGRRRMDEEVEHVRARVAEHFAVDASDLAFLSNVADAVDAIAPALLAPGSGNICLFRHDFPSLLLPLLREAAQAGTQIRWVADEHDLATALDADTRLLAASHVCYMTARRFDIARMRTLCDRHGTRLLVDYSQSAGCIPADWSLHDVGVTAVYKWMLAETGVALLHVKGASAAKPEVAPMGWRAANPPHSASGLMDDIAPFPTARRFERGNLALGSIYTLGSAIDYAEQFSADAVWDHVSGLVDLVATAAAARGLPLLTPRERLHRGASVCIATADTARMAELMERARLRPWAGAGRVRISFHAYNTIADAERVADFLGSTEWI